MSLANPKGVNRRAFYVSPKLFSTLAISNFEHRRFEESIPKISNNKKSQSDNLLEFELCSTQVGNIEEDATEFLRCLWPFLRMYRLFGMFPISKQGNYLVFNRLFNPYWFLKAGALLIQIIMLGTVIKTFAVDDHVDKIISATNGCIYYAHTLGNCLYMTWVIKKVPKFLTSCKRIEILTKKFCSGKNDGLVKSCNILYAAYIAAQVLGNVLYYYTVADKYDANSTTTASTRTEYDGGHFSTILLLVGEFYCDVGWTFADILLCLLALILTRYFVRLNALLRISGKTCTENLEALRSDHMQICKLVEECNDLFSPLFLLNYIASVGFLFTRLFVCLTDDIADPNFSVKLESMFAFGFQILFKLLLPSILAAKLHEKARESLDIVQGWPSIVGAGFVGGDGDGQTTRILTINRFVLQVLTSQVGISGCGYFIISKSFVVTLLSALITYEVIILQFQAAKQ